VLLPMLAVDRDPVFRDGEGRLWRRLGECSFCGDCCYGSDARGRCPHYRGDNDGGLCQVHGSDTYRGFGCDTFPSDPECLRNLPRCTFSFLEVTGGD